MNDVRNDDKKDPDMVLVKTDTPLESLHPDTMMLEEPKVIAYRPQLAKLLGSIDIAIYHQQLTHWQKYAKRDDGFFYKTSKEIEDETYISEKKQRKCREKLVNLGWIEVKKIMANGSPTYHFKVLVKTLSVVVPTGQTPVRTSQNASSITKNTHKNNISSETQKQLDDLYTGYLIKFRVDPDDWMYADSNERKTELIEKAKKGYRLTDKRRDKVLTRLKDAGYEMIKKAIINCGESPWHRGDDPKSNGWFAHLDWICASYERIEDWATRNG